MRMLQAEGAKWNGAHRRRVSAQLAWRSFALDSPFIEQTHVAEAAKQVSYRCLSAARGPADARRSADECKALPT